MRLAISGVGVGGTFLLNRLAELSTPAWEGNEFFLIDHMDFLGRGEAFNHDVSEAVINTGHSRLKPLSPKFYSFGEAMSASQLDATSFDSNPLKRGVYGNYLVETLSRSLQLLRENGVRINFLPGKTEELDFSPESIGLVTSTGCLLSVDYAVISTGAWQNTFSSLPWKGPYLDSPYPLKNAIQQFSDQKSIGILGSGLTAVDVASAFDSSGVTVHMFSPSGRLPWVQSELTARTLEPEFVTEENITNLQDSGELTVPSILGLLDAELSRFGMSREILQDDSWIARHWQNPKRMEKDLLCHQVLSKTNHALNRAFSGLSVFDRRAFRESLGADWTRYRIRIPLARWRQIKNMLDSGRLVLHSGVSAGSSTLEVALGTTECGCLINATGFSADYTEAPSVLNRLSMNGYVGICDEGKGSTDYLTGQAIRSDGKLQSNLFLIGQATAGNNFIVSALDVIHRQAKSVAQELSKTFS